MKEENNKYVQIITKKINPLNSKQDIEEIRQKLENHINNGWTIKNSNMLINNENNIIIYSLLIKE